MARPPQFERSEDLTRDGTTVKVAIKRLSPNDLRIAWMLLYYRDDGAMFSPKIQIRAYEWLLLRKYSCEKGCYPSMRREPSGGCRTDW